MGKTAHYPGPILLCSVAYASPARRKLPSARREYANQLTESLQAQQTYSNLISTTPQNAKRMPKVSTPPFRKHMRTRVHARSEARRRRPVAANPRAGQKNNYENHEPPLKNHEKNGFSSKSTCGRLCTREAKLDVVATNPWLPTPAPATRSAARLLDLGAGGSRRRS